MAIRFQGYNLIRIKAKMEIPKEEILHSGKSDILFLQRLVSENLQDPILSKIAKRIRRNRCSNHSKAERHCR